MTPERLQESEDLEIERLDKLEERGLLVYKRKVSKKRWKELLKEAESDPHHYISYGDEEYQAIEILKDIFEE